MTTVMRMLKGIEGKGCLPLRALAMEKGDQEVDCTDMEGDDGIGDEQL